MTYVKVVGWVEHREAHAVPTSHHRVGLTSFDLPYGQRLRSLAPGSLKNKLPNNHPAQ